MKRTKLVVGVTGGIGCGKSTIVRKISSDKSIPAYFVDERSAYIQNNHPGVVQSTKEKFGEDIYDSEGNLRRAELGDIVFKDPEKLKWLTELLVKPIQEDFEAWKADVEESDAPYMLVESAVFHESKTDSMVDLMVGVQTPYHERMTRIAAREGGSLLRASDRMNAQMNNLEKMELCDLVVGGYGDLEKTCWSLHRKLLKFAKLKA